MTVKRTIAVLTVWVASVFCLSGCVSAQSATCSPDNADDQLALYTTCRPAAANAPLSDQLGVTVLEPDIEIFNRDDAYLGAAAFGTECILVLRYSGSVIPGAESFEFVLNGLLVGRFGPGVQIPLAELTPQQMNEALQTHLSKCS